jgi:hypothetical protein
MPDCRCDREGCPICSPLPNLGMSDTEYRRAELSNRRHRGARPRHTASRQQRGHHDLRQIFDDLNRRYFAGAIDATTAWTRQRKRLGYYKVETRQIYIHHGLDRADVPRFFVAIACQ